MREWDDKSWREQADTPWAWRCRQLQSHYREKILRLTTAGEAWSSRPEPVASMLPKQAVASDPTLNFLKSKEILATVRHRQEIGRAWGGLLNEDRLMRNLLSSQPLCFNLFGFLGLHRDVLSQALSTALRRNLMVVDVRLEWAPARESAESTGGGSAFDAFIEYVAGQRRGFIGIETKYAENLRRQRLPSKERLSHYLKLTKDASSGFSPGAAERLRGSKEHSQLWFNTLLADSLHRARRFHESFVVMLACRDDQEAQRVTNDLRQMRRVRYPAVRWLSYEDLIAAVPFGNGRVDRWRKEFTKRYLNFPMPSSQASTS